MTGYNDMIKELNSSVGTKAYTAVEKAFKNYIDSIATTKLHGFGSESTRNLKCDDVRCSNDSNRFKYCSVQEL